VHVASAHFATAIPDTADYGSLPYPPFIVDFSSVAGDGYPELRIDGYLGSSLVASRRFSFDPSGDRLEVAVDAAQPVGGGGDTDLSPGFAPASP